MRHSFSPWSKRIAAAWIAAAWIAAAWIAAAWIAAASCAFADPPPVPQANVAGQGDAIALPPLEPFSAPAAPSPTLSFVPVEKPLTAPVPWRLSVRHDFGDGPGMFPSNSYRNGFSYLESFIPLLQRPGELVFGDLRVVNFDDSRLWEFNAGVGCRRLLPDANIILGANAFYDVRVSNPFGYQQLGVGVEALGERLEFRSNGYFVLGAGHRTIGVPGTPGAFREVAYSGADAEVGGRLWGLDLIKTRAYIGYYMYAAEESPTAHGIRGRFETDLTSRLSLHGSIQHDRVFDTTASIGIAIHFGAPAFRRGSGAPTISERLGQRVVRDIDVVLNQIPLPVNPPAPSPPPPPPPPPPVGGD
ncbi:MAG: inverse autotransporter beta domain-containing protein [Gemmataceae bacterium]|nr:inverse autotransporter beta domain-containing protein [Gemmataceae bacterium]